MNLELRRYEAEMLPSTATFDSQNCDLISILSKVYNAQIKGKDKQVEEN
jgi:hypothetical protein